MIMVTLCLFVTLQSSKIRHKFTRATVNEAVDIIAVGVCRVQLLVPKVPTLSLTDSQICGYNGILILENMELDRP
jgi:hypothetical protein